MAGDRIPEPAPWERAARQDDGDGWYGASRDAREPRGPRDARDGRDPRDVRDVRDPRDARGRRDELGGRDARGGGRGDGFEGRDGRDGYAGRSDARGSRNDLPAYDDVDADVPSARRGGGRGRGGAGSTAGGSGSGSRFNAKAVVLASTASLLVTAIGTSAFAYQHYNSSINTYDDAGLSKNRPADAPKNAAGQQAMNILLIGSDGRDNGNNAYGGGATGQGARSDTSILLHVYEDHQHAVGISIPRDLMVQIPPCLINPKDPKGADGAKTGVQTAQFNAAFAVGNTSYGNVACEVNTVEAISGIKVDHTMVVGFEAFATMTEDVGGVEVCVPNNVNDGSIQFKKGVQLVSGQKALDYVRERDAFGDGSDIGRTRRQQAFLGALLKKIQSDGVLADPTRISMLINGALKTMTFDPKLGSLSALGGLASDMKGLNPAHVQFLTLPGHYDGARVAMDVNAANVIWDHLKKDQLLDGSSTTATTATTTAAATTTTEAAAPATSAAAPSTAVQIPPASITVQVRNGTQVTGLAGDATAALTAAGYNASVNKTPPPATAVTTIAYGTTSKDKAAAEQLQALYPGSKIEQTARTSTIVVTVGADYAAAHPKTGTSTPGDTGGGAAPGSASSSSAPLPTEIANNSRTAADDPCANITAGFGQPGMG